MKKKERRKKTSKQNRDEIKIPQQRETAPVHFSTITHTCTHTHIHTHIHTRAHTHVHTNTPHHPRSGGSLGAVAPQAESIQGKKKRNPKKRRRKRVSRPYRTHPLPCVLSFGLRFFFFDVI
eukprot:TRINITY_DN5410_c0_g6_i1.p1 TRINITY_DN5410_c0_g6~~TRINITY_DN5410_c0_g6_i1.p1  ORF type:complete len:121 (+),score=8.22 TRINITY_DN5410_c0_g6_i1:35-397(+)